MVLDSFQKSFSGNGLLSYFIVLLVFSLFFDLRANNHAITTVLVTVRHVGWSEKVFTNSSTVSWRFWSKFHGGYRALGALLNNKCFTYRGWVVVFPPTSICRPIYRLWRSSVVWNALCRISISRHSINLCVEWSLEICDIEINEKYLMFESWKGHGCFSFIMSII